MRAVMQANDLWKLYASGDSTIEAVKGVNVKVNQGEMIAIMGLQVVVKRLCWSSIWNRRTDKRRLW